MTDEDTERRPLLATNDNDVGKAKGTDTWFGALKADVLSSWSVYRTILIFFLYQVCYIGQVSANFELARDLTCAQYYEQRPELIDLTDPHPCSADVIEKKSARIRLASDLLFGLGCTLSMLFFGKRLTSWGRKPLLIIGLLPYCLFSLVGIAIPRGYPYGPLADDALLSPTNCVYLFILTGALSGLIGGDSLSICCFRLLVVDHSNSAERTKNLLMYQAVGMLGLTVGPLLFAAISTALPVSPSKVDDILHQMARNIYDLARRTPTPAIMSSSITTQSQGEHVNVTPFILALIGLALAILAVYLFVSETAHTTSADDGLGQGEDGEGECEQPSEAGALPSDPAPAPAATSSKAAAAPSPFRALLPKRRIDGSLDWRILALFASVYFHFAGAVSLNFYILFFGHAMNWGPTAIDYLLSSIGAARLITIFFLVPIVAVYLERTVRRPMQLSKLTIEEIHRLSKGSSAEQAPVGESAFVSDEDRHDIYLLQGAISLWRARVDRTILRLSWGFDILAWLVIAIGAMFREPYTLLFGGIVTLSLASGGLPALQSFGVAVTSDVLSGEEEEGEGAESSSDCQARPTPAPAHAHAHAAETFFAISSVLESVSMTAMMVINNVIYTSTLSTFPAATFFVTVLYYSFAFLALSTIVIHRST